MAKLEEGKDFYFNEQGFMVFTEAYHLARGYCCGSGCKHCPYKNLNSENSKNDSTPKPQA